MSKSIGKFRFLCASSLGIAALGCAPPPGARAELGTPESGGSLVAEFHVQPGCAAIDESHVYASDGSQIVRFPREGGDAEVLIPALGVPSGCVIDNESLIISGEDPGPTNDGGPFDGFPPDGATGLIVRVPRTGGALEILARGELEPRDVRTMGERIVWLSEWSVDGDNIVGSDRIRAVPSGGGAASTVAQFQGSIDSVTLDQGGLSWVGVCDAHAEASCSGDGGRRWLRNDGAEVALQGVPGDGSRGFVQGNSLYTLVGSELLRHSVSGDQTPLASDVPSAPTLAGRTTVREIVQVGESVIVSVQEIEVRELEGDSFQETRVVRSAILRVVGGVTREVAVYEGSFESPVPVRHVLADDKDIFVWMDDGIRRIPNT